MLEITYAEIKVEALGSTAAILGASIQEVRGQKIYHLASHTVLYASRHRKPRFIFTHMQANTTTTQSIHHQCILQD